MFITVISNFLYKKKSVNYKDHIANILKAFQKLFCNMILKVHFLFSQLDRFPDNLCDVSDEQGERFHQDIKVMEERCQGRWNGNLINDYCWSIKRGCLDVKYTKKSRKRNFFLNLTLEKIFFWPFVLKYHIVMFCFSFSV